MITFKYSAQIHTLIFYILLTSSGCLAKGGKGGGGGMRSGSGGFGSRVSSGLGFGNAASRGGGMGGNNARGGYSGGGYSGGTGGAAGAGMGIGMAARGTGNRGTGLGGSSYAMSRSGGMRWASFGTGLLAYHAMSNLARSGHYHSGYYHRNDYYNSHYSKYKGGEECINNEDFNGTVFGKFRCPLPLPAPDFDPSAKYCCGTNQTQYCCRYFDDDTRQITVISIVVCVAAILICSALIISRLVKKRESFKRSYENDSPLRPPMPNGNMMNNGRPPFFNSNMQQRPNNMRPGPGYGPRDGSNVPFLPNPQMPPNLNPGVPYPQGSYRMPPPIGFNGMPQPQGSSMQPPPNFMPMPQPNTINLPPPSYTEVIKKTNDNNSNNNPNSQQPNTEIKT